MIRLLAFLTLAVSFLTTTPVFAAQPCAGALPPGALRAIDTAAPDMAVFSASVRFYTNIERCSRGLAPLVGDPQLLGAAIAQSGYMAQVNVMTHESTRAGMRTLRDRMNIFRVARRLAAENIAQNFVYVLGGRARLLNTAGPCQFVYADTREPVLRHSYASLAQEQVAAWIASPGHYRNIMMQALSRMEAALAYAPDPDSCGRFYISQDFAG